MDIVTGEKLSQFKVAIPSHFILVFSSSRRGGEGIKEGDGWVSLILARYKVHFIRVHDNLL